MDCSGGKSVRHFGRQSLDVGDKDPGRGPVLTDREPVSVCACCQHTLKTAVLRWPARPCRGPASGLSQALPPTRAVLREHTPLPPAGSVCRCCFIPSNAPIHHSTTRTPFRFQPRHAFPSPCAPAKAIFFCRAFTWDNSPVP